MFYTSVYGFVGFCACILRYDFLSIALLFILYVSMYINTYVRFICARLLYAGYVCVFNKLLLIWYLIAF